VPTNRAIYAYRPAGEPAILVEIANPEVKMSLSNSIPRPALSACLVAALLLAGPAPARAAQLTEVAGMCEGSSNPTFYPNSHRLAVVSPRVLALFDPHGTGQQLVYRDSGPWRTETRGDVGDGFFPDPQKADRTASIALAPDGSGRQRAWVATTGHNFDTDYLVAVQLRRLSELKNADGPRVGRALIVQGAERGNARIDLAFERAPSGAYRGVLTWLRRTGDDAYALTVAWFTNLGVDLPKIHHRTTLFTSTNETPTATLVPVPGGIRLVTTDESQRLRVFEHRAQDSLGTWRMGGASVYAGPEARPSAVHLNSGATLSAVEVAPGDDLVEVTRFSATGESSTPSLSLSGYEDPALTRVGPNALLVMIRDEDGAVVSRQYDPTTGWSATDVVEIASGGGEEYAWPNPVRSSKTHLRFLVDGANCSTRSANAVLSYQRKL
jgi:hypothetical protein